MKGSVSRLNLLISACSFSVTILKRASCYARLNGPLTVEVVLGGPCFSLSDICTTRVSLSVIMVTVVSHNCITGSQNKNLAETTVGHLFKKFHSFRS